ncbi:gamma-butyrobetaine dioxygenase-like isoform X1 [Penaeus japonicus]|uniref:gamma-butyrobetaine dioxygenase-like isoform X1 n=1 Tax=Penaeus japonicus TaxID=27405 RepID=UPI001C7157C5|nr:gamma-butyrobetaine dioxygenase-like isoform X1 [Penaeus japonicus]
MSLARLALRHRLSGPPRLLAAETKSSAAAARGRPQLGLQCAPSGAPAFPSFLSFPAAPRALSTPAAGSLDGQRDLNPAAPWPEAAEVVDSTPGTRALRVRFSDGNSHDFPCCWLRDNCQCDVCYDHKSFTRRLVLDDWDQDDYPVHVEVVAPEVRLKWKSGHQSHFHGRWLQDHAFTSSSREKQRTFVALGKDLWGPGFNLDVFEFEELMEDEVTLFKWLVSLEKKGITLIKNTPKEPKACFNIVKKVGFVKPTHYGIHYPIRNKAGANSLAYTDSKLGMHNDLPYYHYVPGIIFLHCLTQFEGAGGENDLADGFYVANHLRQHHPQQYRLLAETPVYFWNKGSALVAQETTQFHKLLNIPLIVEDRDGRVVRVNNSQLRDSHLDLPPEKVTPWYRALRLYNETMERLSIRLKLNDGETLVMDNTRLLHGRTAYEGGKGERYMDQTYLDWDEALSKRRVLQERLQVHVE